MRDFDWQIIVALHRTGSITKAAEGLYISQSALTKRIRAIEGELGFPLLVRTRRGSVFTARGERIACQAAQIAAAIRAVSEERLRDDPSGRPLLTLGAPYSFSRTVLPDLLRSFSAGHPDVRFRILTFPSQDLIKCVENGRAELCFARYYAEDSLLERTLFAENRLFAVCAHSFSLSDLPQLPYIDYPLNPGTAAALERWRAERGLSNPQPVFRVETEELCLSLLRRGLGYGFLLDDCLGGEVGLHALPLRYTDGSAICRQTFLYRDTSRAPQPTADAFCRFAEEFSAGQPEKKPCTPT